MTATTLNWILVIQYIVLSVWYAFSGEGVKGLYWFGAAVLGASVAQMR